MDEGNNAVKKWLLLLARIAVVVAIYYVILRQVPLESLRALLAPSLVAAFLAAVALNVLQAVLCTFRWRLVAVNIDPVPGLAKSFAAYMEGLFFNQALPSFIGGDAVRVLRWRAFNVGTGDAVVSVLRDRLFGAIGAASFTVLACALLWGLPVERYMVISLFLLGAAVTGGCLLLVVLSQWPWLAQLFKRVARIHALAMIFVDRPLSWRRIWQAMATSFVAQVLPGLAVYLLALALQIEIGFVLAATVTGAILLVSMIPVSLAGWGVREAGFLAILVPLGAASENVLMLGISFGLAGLCGALLGGLSLAMGFSLPAVSTPADSGNTDGE